MKDVEQLDEAINRLSVQQFDYAVNEKKSIFSIMQDVDAFEKYRKTRTISGRLKTAEQAFNKHITEKVNKWKESHPKATRAEIQKQERSIIASTLNRIYGDKIYTKAMFDVIDK